MNDKNDNAADVDQINKKTMNAKKLREQWVKDLKEVMSTPAGRRVLGQIIEGSGIKKSSYTGNSETFYKEGRRSIGIWLEDEIKEAAPKEFVLQFNENANT